MTKPQLTYVERRIAELRLDYSECATLLNHFIKKVANVDRIYPRFLPTQASGRWSTIDPPLTNFPKKCINPSCPMERHRKTFECWSMRDCILPDPNEFWIEFDLDAVEARIYALLLKWESRLEEFRLGYDIHTPVTCNLFELPSPCDARDPHAADVDEAWRSLVKWQGKDDKRRTMSKNFTYGGQYFYVTYEPNRKVRKPNVSYQGLVFNPSYVFSIPDIQEYNLDRETLISLACKFVEGTYEIQRAKAEEMERIRRDKIARSFYGFKRVFFHSDEHTAKEGFNHIHQATVVGYINETAIRLQEAFPYSHMVHNAHDNLKWGFEVFHESDGGGEIELILSEVKKIVERDLVYQDRSIPITATFKTIWPRG